MPHSEKRSILCFISESDASIYLQIRLLSSDLSDTLLCKGYYEDLLAPFGVSDEANPDCMCPGNCNGARGVCHRQSTTVVSASGAQHYYLAGQCQCQLGYSGANCSVIEDASNILSFSIANAPGMWLVFLLSFCLFLSLSLYSLAASIQFIPVWYQLE